MACEDFPCCGHAQGDCGDQGGYVFQTIADWGTYGGGEDSSDW